MAFRSLSLSSRKRYITGVSSFLGLDCATQRFQVNQNRAIAMSNFIYKNGLVQKREGIEELFMMKPTKYIVLPFDDTEEHTLLESDFRTNDVNFNGLWSFTAEDKKTHVIAHIGKLLYEVKNLGTDSVEINLIGNNQSMLHNGEIHYYAYEFENYQSSAFIGSNRMYFLGGNKFMCLRFMDNGLGGSITNFYPIEHHNDTYIPTTTISITYKNSSVAGHSNLDKVNLLTQWRKNELISGSLKSEDDITKTEFYDYTLDAPLIAKNNNDMSDVLIILEDGGTIE